MVGGVVPVPPTTATTKTTDSLTGSRKGSRMVPMPSTRHPKETDEMAMTDTPPPQLQDSLLSDDMAEFLSWLIENYHLGDASSVSYFLGKPWKYTDEYYQYIADTRKQA